jgi:FAD/FMN-containing dehydrogenase
MSRTEAERPSGAPHAKIEALDARLDGDAVHAAHPEYHTARRVWNSMIDHHPLVVARCASEADVAAAIAWAREHDLVLTVRGGGHSVAGHSSVHEGVVIDLSKMRDVQVDPDAGRVRVAGGALLGDVDRATQAYGMATPAGVMSETGVAGLALGGGMGWLTRKYGLTCDNLRSARVVLADGRTVTASADENPDLFWGLRGAGSNFGVVTEFEFATHPAGTEFPVGIALYRPEDAPDAIRRYDQTLRAANDDLKVTVFMRLAPEEPWVPEDLVNKPSCMFVSVWTGDPADAEDANAELWGGATPVWSGVQSIPYVELQSMSDPFLNHGACNYTKGAYLGEISDDCIEALITSGEQILSPVSLVEFSYQHGAQGRLDEDDTAFGDRHADHFINVFSRWDPEDEWQPHIDWARGVFERTKPFQTGGVYVNFFGVDDDHRATEAYRGGKYERLGEIKAVYDPDNVFNKNPNVRPASS